MPHQATSPTHPTIVAMPDEAALSSQWPAGTRDRQPVRGLPPYYQALTAAIPVLCIGLLWATHLLDPGIIPSSQYKDPIVDLLDEGRDDAVPSRHLYCWDPGSNLSFPTWKRSPAAGRCGFEKYCRTCNVWRPARAHHCSACDRCMVSMKQLRNAAGPAALIRDRFDHHCGVVGNCIAKNNHGCFAAFLKVTANVSLSIPPHSFGLRTIGCSAWLHLARPSSAEPPGAHMHGQVACQLGAALLLGGVAWRLQLRQFPNKDLWRDPETTVLLFLAVLYAYHVLMLLFGTAHCLGVCLDITTKDVIQGSELRSNLPCCPGSRSPRRLAAHVKQLVAFFGAAGIGAQGGWGAGAVLRACCRPRGTGQTLETMDKFLRRASGGSVPIPPADRLHAVKRKESKPDTRRSVQLRLDLGQ
ncbi:hypothetical protein QJQ45_024208, partial [Haematococcus lacustris]